MRWLRPLIIMACLLAVWQVIVWVTGVQPFILPGPGAVLVTLAERYDTILSHAWAWHQTLISQ